MPVHDFTGLLDGLRQDVEERSYARAAEQPGAAIFVGLDGVLNARLGERILQAQSLLQVLCDVDEVHFAILEEVGFPAHFASILSCLPDRICYVETDETDRSEPFANAVHASSGRGSAMAGSDGARLVFRARLAGWERTY